MPNSLKVRIKKLEHDGKIDTEECDALLKKLEGHDKKLRATAIEEFKERLLELCDGGEECVDCVGGTCTRCFENSVDYSSIVDLAEDLKENKNEKDR